MKYVALLHLLMLTCFGFADSAMAQITAFTYQGRLTDDTGLANGPYDLRFTLYGAAGKVKSGQLKSAMWVPGMVPTQSTGMYPVF